MIYNLFSSKNYTQRVTPQILSIHVSSCPTSFRPIPLASSLWSVLTLRRPKLAKSPKLKYAPKNAKSKRLCGQRIRLKILRIVVGQCKNTRLFLKMRHLIPLHPQVLLHFMVEIFHHLSSNETIWSYLILRSREVQPDVKDELERAQAPLDPGCGG